jgi:hypothetical protein
MYSETETNNTHINTQPNEQRESTHNSINRDKATCPDKVVPRNNNKANK